MPITYMSYAYMCLYAYITYAYGGLHQLCLSPITYSGHAHMGV